MRTVSAIAAFVLMATAPLHAQAIPGRVVEDLTSRPLGTVAVMLLDSTDTAVSWAESDSTGFFALEVRSAGPYRVYADRMGYDQIISEPFSLEGLGPAELELRMLAQPFELEGVTVTTEARIAKLEREGFYRRQRAATGYHLDAKEIQAIHPSRTTTLLRRLPGVLIRPSRWGDVAVNPRHYRPCPMKVVLDGWTLDLSTTPLDHWVDPDRIIGVEVYPNRGVGAPMLHRSTDAFCGVIMIWTR